MNNIVNKIKDNKFIILGGIVTFLLCSLVIGATYSYLSSSATNSSAITGTVAFAGLKVTVEKKAPSSNKGLVPQLNSAIESAVVGTNGNCIDGNNNEVCQVYEIIVTNTGGTVVNVDGILDLDVGNNSNLSWARIDSYVSNMKSKSTVLGGKYLHTSKNFVANDKITPGSPKKYYLVLWISETGGIQTDNGNFTGTITFKTSEALTPSSTTLYKLGLAPNANALEINPTFTNPSNLDGTLGIYKTEDYYGDTYYFRGDVENNYVKFGKYEKDAYAIYDSNTLTSTFSNTCSSGGDCTKIASAGDDMYWRIIRINGDGTIRLLYAGTKPYSNSKLYALKHIGTSAFNKNYTDNAYVGYMYGTVPSTSYENAHANTNSSTIKLMIESWYTKYLETNYKNSIADSVFCYDRSKANGSIYLAGVQFTNEGYGNKQTLYGMWNRMDLSDFPNQVKSITTSMKCVNSNDYYSVKNGNLTKPIGLITADELINGGLYISKDNTKSYLSDNSWYWSASSSHFISDIAGVFYASSNVGGGSYVESSSAVRVSVSLNSTAIKSGSGTANDPFVV